jgi:16S rRNA (guanine(527)-N(7))-methyltransferase RsmG
MTPSHIEVLESELRKFQIDVPSPQKILLARYCDELVRWNKKINLTGLSGADMVRRLVVEPVWIARELKPEGALADIGSGNGSPAIPICVVSNLRKAHLIEARTKRAAFLRHLITTLTLSGVVVDRARLEEVASGLEVVDWITLQGVALNEQLLLSLRPMVSSTTTVVWITSADVSTPRKPLRTIEVPITGTRVFLFALDTQSLGGGEA